MRKSSPAVAGVEAAIAGSKPWREKAGQERSPGGGRRREGPGDEGTEEREGKILIWLWLSIFGVHQFGGAPEIGPPLNPNFRPIS
jgi:hypothetical protein